jgi:small subunit ribosomal protein S5
MQPMQTNNRPNRFQNQEPKEFDEKVVQVNRVSKKTKGGNKIGFSVLVVVGDKNGKVGVGMGKGPDVLSSIKKAIRRAKKHMITLPLKNGTIPFPVEIKRGAARLILKPAPEGTGVIAGGAVRAVVEAAGVSNIVSKILGSSNQASNVYATFAALEKMRQIASIKNIKLTNTPKPVIADKAPVSNPSKANTQPKTQVTRKESPVTTKTPATAKPNSTVKSATK